MHKSLTGCGRKNGVRIQGSVTLYKQFGTAFTFPPFQNKHPHRAHHSTPSYSPAGQRQREFPQIPYYDVLFPKYNRFSMTAPSTIAQKFLSHPQELGVVAVGFSGGQGKAGVDGGPQALIEAGLLEQLSADLEYRVFHDGQVHAYDELRPAAGADPPHRGMKNPRLVSAVTRRLADQVYEHAGRGRFALTVGGDHSIAIGTIAGSSRAIRERFPSKELAVIWVDAHADINTPESSGSGNVHGMPVAFLTGLASDDIFGWLGTAAAKGENGVANGTNGHSTAATPAASQPPLNLKKLVYIGLRDVDRGEKRILRENGIKAFSMHDIDKHGIGRVMEMALAHIGSDTPIHLSFDVDALDPQWAPSTGTPVRGGLTLREGDYIAECVHETGSLVAMDLVEVNPSLQPLSAQETVGAGCSLVRCALGDTLL